MYKTWKLAIIGLGVGIGTIILCIVGLNTIKFCFRIFGLMLEYPIEAISTIISLFGIIYIIYRLKNSNII